MQIRTLVPNDNPTRIQISFIRQAQKNQLNNSIKNGILELHPKHDEFETKKLHYAYTTSLCCLEPVEISETTPP